jgi:hypothetical protein
MGNLSRAAFFDAGVNKPPVRSFVYNGEHRVDKHPSGHVERWIDPSGNVMFVQLVPPGVPKSVQAYNAARAKLETSVPGDKKWIEHKVCPLANGKLDYDLFPANLQRPCRKGSYGRGQACPHVEHVIEKRRAEHQAAVDLRRAPALAERKRREKQEQDGINETRRLNDNLEKIVTAVAGGVARKGKKPAAAPAPKREANHASDTATGARARRSIAPPSEPDGDLDLSDVTAESEPRAARPTKKKIARKPRR